MRQTAKLVLGASTLVLASAGSMAMAQEDTTLRQSTVTVTGSFIAGTPEDAALPVDVLSADDLQLEGSPRIDELIRNLGVSSGVDGQTNQFSSNGLEGTSNINLRGLGPARTLVLINGKRQTFAPYGIGEQAQLFVDTNMIPSAAIKRVELLKDGAAALYGSDAIAGVVNFITNDDLDGIEIAGDFQSFDGSDGDYNLSAAFGWQGENTGWVTTVGYTFRSEASFRDTLGTPTLIENEVAGWSGLSNPGRFVTIGFLPDGSIGANGNVVDAGCEDVGGQLHPNVGDCRFQFLQYDNLVEEEERINIFSEFNHEFGNGTELHLEAMYGMTDVPTWKSSPSYPPQVLTNQVLFPSHPGWQAYTAANPGTQLDTAFQALYIGRTYGWGGYPVTGGAGEGYRTYDAYRAAGDLSGTFENGINWDVGVGYSITKGERVTNDTYIVGLTAALRGFGVCTDPVTGFDPATGTQPWAVDYSGSLSAGGGACEYYNPFSNSIPQSGVTGEPNPNYVPGLENTVTLADWMQDGSGTEVESSLLTFDAVINGSSGVQAAGGEIGWAAGAQVRKETYDVNAFPVSDCDVTPGPNGDGPFSFLGCTNSGDSDQSIYAIFGELQIPLYEDLDIQVAMRYEDYGGEIGSTFDPKIAAKWQVNDMFAIRGSAQTSFRGPTLNQTQGRFTTLQFIAPTSAFKAVDTFADPGLSPESAFSYNIGALFQKDSFSASLDFYSFDFSDPILVEDHNPIVNAAIAALGTATTDDDAILNRITFNDPTAPSAASISRIETNIFNGPNIKTSGLDARLEKDWAFSNGSLFTVGLDATYVLEYDVADFMIEDRTIEGGDYAGQFNRSNFTRSMPQWKGNFFANYNWDAPWGNNNVRAVLRHIDSYKDERGEITPLNGTDDSTIDSQTTLDLYFLTELPYDFDLGLSVVNVFDEDPPFVQFDPNYDPYTHNPFGRTVKISASKKFGFPG